MAVLSTQLAAIIIYCKNISEITWVPYHCADVSIQKRTVIYATHLEPSSQEA